MASNSSGIWSPPSHTPTGVPFKYAQDIQYVDKSDFIKDYIVKHGLGITASDPEYTDGTLDDVLLEASSNINRKTGRHFNVQTIDETFSRYTLGFESTKDYVTIRLTEMPIRAINTIYFEVLGQFTQIDLTYLQNSFPDQGFFQIIPNLTSAAGTSLPIPRDTTIGNYWVNYSFGYDVLPSGITKAVILEAVKLISLQRNVLGLAELRTNQKTFKWGETNKIDDQIDILLAPYKKMQLASA